MFPGTTNEPVPDRHGRFAPQALAPEQTQVLLSRPQVKGRLVGPSRGPITSFIPGESPRERKSTTLADGSNWARSSRAFRGGPGRVREPCTHSETVGRTPACPIGDPGLITRRSQVQFLPPQSRKTEAQQLLRLRSFCVLPLTDSVALLRGAEGGNASPESRADDHQVVVEALYPRASPRGTGRGTPAARGIPTHDQTPTPGR